MKYFLIMFATAVTFSFFSGKSYADDVNELDLENHMTKPTLSAPIAEEPKEIEKKPEAKQPSALQSAMNTANFIYNEAPPIKDIADGYKAVYDKSIADASAEILDRVKNGKSANWFVNNLIGAKHGFINSFKFTTKKFAAPIIKFFTGYDVSKIINTVMN